MIMNYLLFVQFIKYIMKPMFLTMILQISTNQRISSSVDKPRIHFGAAGGAHRDD